MGLGIHIRVDPQSDPGLSSHGRGRVAEHLQFLRRLHIEHQNINVQRRAYLLHRFSHTGKNDSIARNTGFYRPEKHHTEATVHADAVHIGSLFHDNLEGLAPLARAISAGDIPCQVTRAIEKDLWAKMLYNCALNPLGAIFDVTYGTLGEWPHTRAIMDRIVDEIFAVMGASGYRTHWDTSDAYLAFFYGTLLPPTSSHRSQGSSHMLL